MRTLLAACVLSIFVIGAAEPALARSPGHLTKRRVIKAMLKTNLGKRFIAHRRIAKARRLMVKQPGKALRLIIGTLNSKIATVSPRTAYKAARVANQALVYKLSSWQRRAALQLKPGAKRNKNTMQKLDRELSSTTGTMSRLYYRDSWLVAKSVDKRYGVAQLQQAALRYRLSPAAANHPYLGASAK